MRAVDAPNAIGTLVRAADLEPDPAVALEAEGARLVAEDRNKPLLGGAATAKVIINKTSVLGVSNAQDPHREHPRFNAANNDGTAALQTFYDATMLRVNTPGLCAPRPLLNQ